MHARNVVARIARVLTGATTALSFLVAVAAVVLWIRTYWVWDYFSYIRPDSASDRQRPGLVVNIAFPKGRIRLSVAHWDRLPREVRVPPSHVGWYYRTAAPQPPPQPSESVGSTRYVNGLGFLLEINRPPETPPPKQPGLSVVAVPNWRAAVPLWFVVLCASIAPALWFAGRFRARRGRLRAQRNQCPACGYDLRAGHDKCPECGAPVVAPAKSSPTAATPKPT
jgi:hypothetical protein